MDWLLEMDLPEFTLAEIVEMENLYRQVGEESLRQEFCQEIATRFSCSSNRAGKSAIQWEQVQSWFQSKQKKPPANVTSSSIGSKKSNVTSSSIGPKKKKKSIRGVNFSSYEPESSQKPKGDRVKDLSELAFEAKSGRDNAWYDVGSFLTYRVMCTGELEVRVRFAGFGKDHDEWVNVKKGVRERSIPLEPSECEKVNVGDLVLCYQERLDHALYCDAHIVEIQRRLHDIRGCRCIFVVRYDHDHSEEKVQLKRICSRPK